MHPLPVSIIVPNYNGEQILGSTLASIVAAADAYGGMCEIIVVDDASEDGSVELIAANYAEIRVVRHQENKGFAEAVHSGVNASIYEMIILLNSDVRPHRNFIEPLVRWFNREDIFSVSPLMRDRQGEPVRFSWNLVDIVRGKMRRRKWNLEEVQKLTSGGRAVKSLYATGGAIACRKEMFLKLQGFLPLYKPFYDEDLDLGIRAWRRGWQTLFDPGSMVVHDHRQSTIKRFFSERDIRIIRRRNRFFSMWLHLSTSKLMFSQIPWTFIRLAWRIVRMDTVYAVGLFRALSRLGEIIKLRRDLKREHNPKSWEEIIEEIDSLRVQECQ